RNLVPMVGNHVIDAELCGALFTSFSEQDYVPVEWHLEAVQQQEHFQISGVHALIVNGPAPVKIAAFDCRSKGIHRPFVPLNSNHVQMSHEQQWPLFAIAFESCHQVAATGSRLKYLRMDALRSRNSLDVFGRTGFISGRIAGINFDWFGVTPDGF